MLDRLAIAAIVTEAAKGVTGPRIVWAVSDASTRVALPSTSLTVATTIAHSLDEAAAIDLARERNAESSVTGRYQVERSIVLSTGDVWTLPNCMLI